ncbi:MAG: hypothetical protein JWM88_2692 [Verrucomicrobia bacterium]|nr:hypothetical protein [Verrucomicrobiota bacterium]
MVRIILIDGDAFIPNTLSQMLDTDCLLSKPPSFADLGTVITEALGRALGNLVVVAARKASLSQP